jgi:hypothetical protein
MSSETYNDCGHCACWHVEIDTDEDGECRKHPPVIHPAAKRNDNLRVWPMTPAEDWCAEFEKREVVGPAPHGEHAHLSDRHAARRARRARQLDT